MNKRLYNSLYNAAKKERKSQIILPADEYARVMSAFNSNLSEEDRKKRYITKPVGDYYYSFVNLGYDDYIVVGKYPIDGDFDAKWETI